MNNESHMRESSQDPSDSIGLRGSMSIRDLIVPEESIQTRNPMMMPTTTTTTDQMMSNTGVSGEKRKRGRPKNSERPTSNMVRKKFEKKTYVDNPEIRNRIAALESYIDLYDQSIKSSGRPRVYPLRETLTRKKVSTFPEDVQLKCQEYIELKKLLPPAKPLGRPRKSNIDESQNKNSSYFLDELPLLNVNTSTRAPGGRNNNGDPFGIPNGYNNGRPPSAEAKYSERLHNMNSLSDQLSDYAEDVSTPATSESEKELTPEPKKRGRPPKVATTTTATTPFQILKRGRPRKIVEADKPKRGRPRKITNSFSILPKNLLQPPPALKKRGRPRKNEPINVKRPVGRPRKTTTTRKFDDEPDHKPTSLYSGMLNNKRISRNSNPRLNPIQRVHYLISSDSGLQKKLKTHFKNDGDDSSANTAPNNWGFVQQDTCVRVSKIYLLLLLNPGLKDSVKL